MKQLEEIERLMEEREVHFIDLKTVDQRGQWRHVTIPSAQLSSSLLNEGIGFDASSYGYRPVHQSDLLLVPDLATARIEDFSSESYLSLISDVCKVMDGVRMPFPQDPRGTARRAEEYLRKSKIADQLFLSPEFEFYIFDRIELAYRPERVHLFIRSSQVPSEDTGEGTGHYLRPHAG